MAQYFENDENLKSEEKIIEVKIKNITLKLTTDNGVFSKNKLDFGTRTLLGNINFENVNGDILDFGCGYGPVGIYVKKVTNANVHMVDINKRSLSLANKNAKLNGVDVKIYESNIYSNIKEKFDYIITNPPIRVGKKILYQIIFGAIDYLKDNGVIYLVIHKDQGAKSVLKDLSDKYETTLITKNKGFYIIMAKKH